MAKLRYLKLSFTDVGDRGVAALVELRALEELDLWKTKVTAKSLDSFKEMKQLKRLLLPASEEFPEDAVAELQMALPRTKIER